MLRVLYHIGKDTKYIANKKECNRFFIRLPRGGGHNIQRSYKTITLYFN